MKLRKRLFTIAAITTAACVADVSASAANSGDGRFQITGIVRTICRVNFSNPVAPQQDGHVDFGAMTQLCNSAEGYRLILMHPSGLSGAKFRIGNSEVLLNSGTETVLAEASVPTYRLANAELELGAQTELSTISFRMEPKGMVY